MSLGGLPDDFIMRAWAAFRLLCRQLGQTLHGASNQQFYRAGAGLRQEEVFPERLKGSTELVVAGTDEGGGPAPKGIPLWPNLRNCDVAIVASKGVQTGGCRTVAEHLSHRCQTLGSDLKTAETGGKCSKNGTGWEEPDSRRRKVSA